MSAVGSVHLVDVGGADVAIADAQAFAVALARNWDGGLLVARSAEPGRGGPRKTGGFSASSKCSFREFAEAASVDRATVRRYFDAWERAAADGLVPRAVDLSPGEPVDLTRAKCGPRTWDDYYFVTGRRAPQAPEWDGMPSFEAIPPRVVLAVAFADTDSRDEFIERLGLVVSKRTKGTWSALWPPREQEDLSSLRFDFEDAV